MTLKKLLGAVLVLVPLVVSVPVQAAGWYVGAGLGVGHAADADSNVFGSVAILSGGGIPVIGSYDSSNPLVQVFGGYQFNRYVAAEAGYTDFGSYTLNGLAAVGNGYVAVSETDRIDALYIAAVGSIPLTSSVSLFGKLGLASSRDRETCYVTGAACPSVSSSQTEPVIGVGVEFPFTPVRLRQHLAMRVEYDVFPSIGNGMEYTAGNFDALTVNGIYHF